MMLDLQTKFSAVQVVGASAISTNVVDLRQAATPALADEGLSGPEMWLVISVDVAATAAGAATVQFSLESDSTADLATSPTVHYITAAIGKAALVIGFTAVRIQVPSGDYERFLGVRYTVATGPLTAGAFTAFLTPDVARNISYPAGFTIDV
jgi:hypothetical protein